MAIKSKVNIRFDFVID